jgi:hypothetical protein
MCIKTGNLSTLTLPISQKSGGDDCNPIFAHSQFHPQSTNEYLMCNIEDFYKEAIRIQTEGNHALEKTVHKLQELQLETKVNSAEVTEKQSIVAGLSDQLRTAEQILNGCKSSLESALCSISLKVYNMAFLSFYFIYIYVYVFSFV